MHRRREHFRQQFSGRAPGNLLYGVDILHTLNFFGQHIGRLNALSAAKAQQRLGRLAVSTVSSLQGRALALGAAVGLHLIQTLDQQGNAAGRAVSCQFLILQTGFGQILSHNSLQLVQRRLHKPRRNFLNTDFKK